MAGWTDDDLFKKLHADGASMAVIGARFGKTRSAACGKAKRLGLSVPRAERQKRAASVRSKNYHAGKPRKPKEPSCSPWRGAGVRITDQPGYVMPAHAEPELVIPIKQRKSILQLEAADCRWPIGHVGEADFHFCGKQKVAGRGSYCEFHMRRSAPPLQSVARAVARTEDSVATEATRERREVADDRQLVAATIG